MDDLFDVLELILNGPDYTGGGPKNCTHFKSCYYVLPFKVELN